VPSGLRAVTRKDLPKDAVIVKCPFDLVITEQLAQKCLLGIMDLGNVVKSNQWNERQWIVSYLCFHRIVKSSSHLLHYAYLEALPSAEQLRTPLHFTAMELELFRGTNLYGATLDRRAEWELEWSKCRTYFLALNQALGEKFSWELYLSAATYLSSRAFPSSLLLTNPSLLSSPDTKPILIPGVDALNHGRAQPVSWVVSHTDVHNTEMKTSSINLVLHYALKEGQELLNNYGAKPNSELILGYGFSLPHNPDDTIVFKIGGIDGKKWEVGRSARGVEGLWDEILRSVQQDPDLDSTYEDRLDAAAALHDMLHSLMERLPTRDKNLREVRTEVAKMFYDYIEGQRDILESLKIFASQQEQLVIEEAHADGIDIVLE